MIRYPQSVRPLHGLSEPSIHGPKHTEKERRAVVVKIYNKDRVCDLISIIII